MMLWLVSNSVQISGFI